MNKALLLCLLVAAAVGGARAEACLTGMEGPGCAMCDPTFPMADLACANFTQNDQAWCFTNHTWVPESASKTYDCTTENTDFADSVSDVWAQCYTDVKKCDVHFALGGYPLTCGGLDCSFEGTGVYCSYTKCACDGGCPYVNGVSLGYMLERLTGKTSLHCGEGWPYALCSIDIEGLSAAAGGFEAYCKAAECAVW